MKTCIKTVGISGSGKSYWAKQYIKDNPNTIEINRDDIRIQLFKSLYLGEFSWKEWSWKWESDVTRLQKTLILDAALNDKNIILSDTHLTPKNSKDIDLYLTDLGFNITYNYFDTPIEICIERDSKRVAPVGESVIRKQYESFKKLRG